MNCGNDGSAADSQHPATELTDELGKDQNPLAADADYVIEHCLCGMVEGRPGLG